MQIIKWLTIGFLGTVGILAAFILALMWKFSPLLVIDDKKQTVELLGGTIHIDIDESRGVADKEDAI